jgi:hypothetical protein
VWFGSGTKRREAFWQRGDRRPILSGVGGARGGGSGTGATCGGEQGGVRHGRDAQRGRGPAEQKPEHSGEGGVWAAREAGERGDACGSCVQALGPDDQ